MPFNYAVSLHYMFLFSVVTEAARLAPFGLGAPVPFPMCTMLSGFLQGALPLFPLKGGKFQFIPGVASFFFPSA